MKNILKYYFKKRKLLIIIATAILLLINFTVLTNSTFVIDREINGAIVMYANDAPINMFTIMSLILASIIPIFEFSYKMKKINVDQMYSLPIKKEKLFFGTLIFSIIELVIPITLNYIVMLIFTLLSENMFNIGLLILFYVFLIVLSISVLCIVAFIYTRNNTIFDGIINVLFIIFVPFLLVFALRNIFKVYAGGPVYYFNEIFNQSMYFIYSPLSYWSERFMKYIENKDVFDNFFKDSMYNSKIENIHLLVLSVVQIILAILSAIGIKYLTRKEKGEETMQKSTSAFSYKTMIPLSTIILFVLAKDDILVFLPLLSIYAFIMYCIYQRTIKLKGKQILHIGMILTIGFILSFVSYYIGKEIAKIQTIDEYYYLIIK